MSRVPAWVWLGHILVESRGNERDVSRRPGKKKEYGAFQISEEEFDEVVRGKASSLGTVKDLLTIHGSMLAAAVLYDEYSRRLRVVTVGGTPEVMILAYLCFSVGGPTVSRVIREAAQRYGRTADGRVPVESVFREIRCLAGSEMFKGRGSRWINALDRVARITAFGPLLERELRRLERRER
jgi:hypothetical protein